MNGNNQVRQISPEEVQRAQGRQMTAEQLQQVQQTQVLNIKEVERTARYEKMTSKKPAMIVAIIGLLSIFMGTTFQVVDTLSAKKVNGNDIKKRTTDVTETVPAAITSYMSCNKSLADVNSGTDKSYNISLVFEDNLLQSYTKTFKVVAMEGNPTGITTIQSYIQRFENYKNSTEGYSVSVTQTENNTSITTSVDYTLLDPSKVVNVQNETDMTKLDFNTSTSKDNVKTYYEAKNYVCE